MSEENLTMKDLENMVSLIKKIDHLEDILYDGLYEDEEEEKEIERQVRDLWGEVIKILRTTDKYPRDLISAAIDSVLNQYYISKTH